MYGNIPIFVSTTQEVDTQKVADLSIKICFDFRSKLAIKVLLYFVSLTEVYEVINIETDVQGRGYLFVIENTGEDGGCFSQM